MSNPSLTQQTPALVRTRVGLLPEPLAALLHSKRLILGKYRLERLVGRGGMSVVFAAEHTMLRKRVAIKFLSLDQCESGVAVARFLHEGRSAARIRSEHVARVIDVDTIPGGLPCMVLEYLDGHDLAYTLRRRGALPMELAVDYVMQALEAVAEAHTLNIVHRDLKPSNLFVVQRADGKKDIKVIDFGISKSIGDSDQTAFTKRHSILGSPEYMSPEQAQGEIDVDTRTDLWSMGVVLYELLCGSCPFEGADYMEILSKVTRDDPPSISAKCPHIPSPLERIIRRCLQRDRDKRCQTASELARALLPFGSELARFSYDSILGVCAKADQEPVSSTLTGAQSSMPNEDAGREEWKRLATGDFALAVDRFGSRAQWPSALAAVASDEAPTERGTSAPEAAMDDIAPSKDFTQRTPEALPAAPAPSAPVSDKSDDDARRPLISVVRGPLPSVTDMEGTSSTEQKWIHRPKIRERHVSRHRSSRGGQKQRSDVVLWGVCVLAVLTVVALLADRYRRAEPTATARPSPSVAATMIQPVPLSERGTQLFDLEWANLAPPIRP
jgi:eukaryotic-like serine/threonine-protein kinase